MQSVSTFIKIVEWPWSETIKDESRLVLSEYCTGDESHARLAHKVAEKNVVKLKKNYIKLSNDRAKNKICSLYLPTVALRSAFPVHKGN